MRRPSGARKSPWENAFGTLDFIAELTQHIPPKHKHIIRYYGLYSSRTKGKTLRDGSMVKFGYPVASGKKPSQAPDPGECRHSLMDTVSSKALRRNWARLIQRVYEVDPLTCPKCGHEMRVMAVITEPHEVRKILECLKRNHAPPFEKVVTKVSYDLYPILCCTQRMTPGMMCAHFSSEKAIYFSYCTGGSCHNSMI